MYTDPTGHASDNCRLYIDEYCVETHRFLLVIFDDDGIQHWTGEEMESVRNATYDVAARLSDQINMNWARRAKYLQQHLGEEGGD
jgi:hypothetical protein